MIPALSSSLLLLNEELLLLIAGDEFADDALERCAAEEEVSVPIVYDFPELVWPYARTVTLYPSMKRETSL